MFKRATNGNRVPSRLQRPNHSYSINTIKGGSYCKLTLHLKKTNTKQVCNCLTGTYSVMLRNTGQISNNYPYSALHVARVQRNMGPTVSFERVPYSFAVSGVEDQNLTKTVRAVSFFFPFSFFLEGLGVTVHEKNGPNNPLIILLFPVEGASISP